MLNYNNINFMNMVGFYVLFGYNIRIHLHFTSGIFDLQGYTIFSTREKLPSFSKIYNGVIIYKISLDLIFYNN